MKIIVGLGNPGISYEKTRHNLGFLYTSQLQKDYHFSSWKEEKKFKALLSKGEFDGQEVFLLQPQTFMNLSGESVGKICHFYRLNFQEDLILAYDDLDLPFGHFKIAHKGPREHNGLLHIRQVLKTDNFLQIRLGTDSRRLREKRIPGADYVLQNLSNQELQILHDETFPAVNQELLTWL